MASPFKRFLAWSCASVLVLGSLVATVLMWQPGARQPEEVQILIVPSPAAPRVATPHEKAVIAAVAKGAAYLKKRLLTGPPASSAGHAVLSDTQTGAASLMALALLEAGAPPGDPAVQKALTLVRQTQKELRPTYVLGATLLFLNRLQEVDALGQPDQAIVRSLALRLIAGQSPQGLWSYGNSPLAPQVEAKLLKDLQSRSYRPSGDVVRYCSTSMTQFAMLSLWGARRCGVPVQIPLLKAAAYFHETQQPNGSWGYKKAIPPFDSNTCAGLLALAMEQALLSDPEFAHDPAPAPKATAKVADMRRKAFAWLAPVIGQDPKKPNHRYQGYPGMGRLIGASANGDCYFLWTFERMAVIYDLKLIDGKDWHKWGSEVLVQAQAQDGSWSDGYDPAIDTAFAILFLTRANLAKDLTDKLRLLEQKTSATDPILPRREGVGG
jgi:hypothetical protein